MSSLMLLKTDLRKPRTSAASAFIPSVEVTALPKAPFAGRQRQGRASLSALLTPAAQAASGFVWGFLIPAAPQTPHNYCAPGHLCLELQQCSAGDHVKDPPYC